MTSAFSRERDHGVQVFDCMAKKPPALRLRRRPTAKTTGLLDKFKVSKLPVGVGVPSATVTSGEGRSEQLEHTRGEKVERNKNHA